MLRALRDFNQTGKLLGTRATIDALISMRYVKASLRPDGQGFDYVLTTRGRDLVASVPAELTMPKPRRVDLPVMTCVPGCGDCCGPVPITAKERDTIRDYISKLGITPRYTDYLTCPFFQEGSCQVYPVRPLVCSIFGHTRKMSCPNGCNKFVPEKITHQMMRENGPAVGLLPEIFKVPAGG